MITGIGTDVLDIERIHGILAGKNKMRFLNRLLTVAELERVQRIPHVERVVEFIAGRFALKEAVAKAFGCGIGGMVGFQDIEIKAEPSGKPQCTVTKEALERLKIGGDLTIHVSVSHSQRQVVAFAVVEKRSF